MKFDSFSDFLAMGGYGFYVWLAFGVSMLALAGLWLVSVAERRQLFKTLQQQQARQARIAKAAQQEQHQQIQQQD